MASIIDKDKTEIVELLVRAGNRLTRASMYADAYLEYKAAMKNIEEYGLIVNHPRTGNPIENPYLSIRDKAFKKMDDMRDVEADELW